MHQLMCSNNTNKLSPQERLLTTFSCPERSNNTNKLSPQERGDLMLCCPTVQIIQINLVLKNQSGNRHPLSLFK